MTLREKLERAKPSIDSPTYRRLTGQMSEKDYRKALQDESRRITHRDGKQAASSHEQG
jgi:hypothetical protein